jgi:hypothetical protein
MTSHSLFLTVKNHINISLMDDSKAAAAVIGRRKLNCTYRQEADVAHAYPQMPFGQIQVGLVRFVDF